MLASLDEVFLETVNSQRGGVFIDELWADRQSSNYRRKLRQCTKTKYYLEMDANDLTETEVVSAIAQFKLILGDQSAYRKATDFLESKTSGVMVFHHSHLLAANVLHLVSRLMRYTQRQNLEWKFVFFGDDKAMKSLKIDQLFIEKTYPSKKIKSATKKQILTITTGLICLAILALVFLVKPDSKETSDNINSIDAAAIIESDDLQVNKYTEETTPSTESLEIIRQSKLRDLEFNGMLAELDSQVPVINENDRLPSTTVNESVSTAPKISQSNIEHPLQLSSGAEDAIRNNDLGVVQKLLSSNVLRSSKNNNGQTPLIIATNSGNHQIVEWLLSEDSLVNSTDLYGRSAIFYASINGDDALLEILLEAGAQVDIASNLSKTPLMAAVHNEHFSIVETLLKNDIDIDAVDHSGWSAIFYAVWNSNTSMVELLIDNGVNTNIKDNSGLSLIEIAEARGNASIVDLL